MAIIFDLDMTILDTSVADKFRLCRRWNEVYRLIPSFKPYEGIMEFLEELNMLAIPMAIVTSSPRPYCEKIINHWKLPVRNAVCYHDTVNHKPHPDPLLKAAQLMGKAPSDFYALGDDIKDIQAARSAGMMSIGALWGVADKYRVVESAPDAYFETVAEARSYLLKYLQCKQN